MYDLAKVSLGKGGAVIQTEVFLTPMSHSQCEVRLLPPKDSSH